MSGRICGAIFDRGPDKRPERFVLLAIGEYANKRGSCFPYIETLAKRTLFTREYVGKVLEKLIKDRWVDRTFHPKNHRSCGYQINLEKLGISVEQSSCEIQNDDEGSCEICGGSHVKSDMGSCEIRQKPLHPLKEEPLRTAKEPSLSVREEKTNEAKSETAESEKEQIEAIYEAYPRSAGKPYALKAIRGAV